MRHPYDIMSYNYLVNISKKMLLSNDIINFPEAFNNFNGLSDELCCESH